MTTHNINTTIQLPNNSRGDLESGDDRSANWEDLANTLQEKANKRLDDVNLLVSRAAITIAAIAFIVPDLLKQDLDAFSFTLVAIPVVLSFICIIISIFTNTPVPIKPDEAVSMLESEDYCNMSRREFSRWKARSYRDGLQGFNKAYEKKRRWQLASFILLGLAILLLLLFRYVTIDIIWRMKC